MPVGCSDASVFPFAEPMARREVLAGAAAFGVGAVLLSLSGCIGRGETSEDAAERMDRGSWPQWRGPGRDGQVPRLPSRLSPLRVRWQVPLGDEGLAGIAVQERLVAVADHVPKRDIYRLFDLSTGQERWRCERTNHHDLDYGSAPRATPLFAEGFLFVLGAAGELLCLRLADGEIQWKRNLLTDFGAAELPTWGYCSSPLIVDGRLIVNPGVADAAAVVALDPNTGTLLWAAPGAAANYSSFIAGQFGGVSQAIGYDQKGLCGWACDSGQLLWRVETGLGKGYVVPTPIAWQGKLIVAHERGTALYGFGSSGEIGRRPLAETRQLSPSISTPTLAGDWLLGHDNRRMIALSLNDGLNVHWKGPSTSSSKFLPV